MEAVSFAEILAAVIMVLGGQHGLSEYRRRKFLNGDRGSDRRRDTKAVGGLTPSDREFVKGCFDTLGMQISNALLQQTRDVEKTVREEGTATRVAVRDKN